MLMLMLMKRGYRGEVATKRRAFVAPSLEMVKDYF